jgi:amidase
MNSSANSDARGLHFLPAHALAKKIRAREVGCREALEVYLDRLQEANPRINAVVTTDLESAKAQSDEADRQLARGEPVGPLHGVPMTVKESFDVVGMPTTWGVGGFADNLPARDAVAVARLRAAGAIVFGKTNVPVRLADWQTYNSVFGTTVNPWDETRTPGGSSGGSAAALASGLTALELGSDLAGSLRNPAHYCGVYSHRPTYGLVPQRGHSLNGRQVAEEFSAIGPMARSAEDLETSLGILSGPDRGAGEGFVLKLPAARGARISDYRIAVMLDDPTARVDSAVQDKIQDVVDTLARGGASINDRARPDVASEQSHALFMRMIRAATAARLDEATFTEMLSRARSVDAPDDFHTRTARAVTVTHREWLLDKERKEQISRKWHAFFEDYDVLICPAAATTAVPNDQEGERHTRVISINGVETSVLKQMFWAGYPALADLPSTTVPAGPGADGLPVGLQMVGQRYADLTTIMLGRLLEREGIAFIPPPGL